MPTGSTRFCWQKSCGIRSKVVDVSLNRLMLYGARFTARALATRNWNGVIL